MKTVSSSQRMGKAMQFAAHIPGHMVGLIVLTTLLTAWLFTDPLFRWRDYFARGVRPREIKGRLRVGIGGDLIQPREVPAIRCAAATISLPVVPAASQIFPGESVSNARPAAEVPCDFAPAARWLPGVAGGAAMTATTKDLPHGLPLAPD